MPGVHAQDWSSAEPWTGRLKKLDSESIKSQEIIYNQDFNIAQLERRIARMQGEVWLISITHNKWHMAHFRWIMKKRLPLKNDWPRLVFKLKLSDSLSIWRSLLIGWRIRNQIRNPDKLNGTLEEKHKTKKILDEQQRKLQVNLRRCQVEMEKCTREHDALNSKIEELELYDDSSQRELKRKRLTQFTKFHFLIPLFDFDFLYFWF